MVACTRARVSWSASWSRARRFEERLAQQFDVTEHVDLAYRIARTLERSTDAA